MCAKCGCGVGGHHQHHHDHHHHDHHEHEHEEAGHGRAYGREEGEEEESRGRLMRLQVDLLGRNDEVARWNRATFVAGGVLALNLVSSPGAGKTSLLERMARDARPGWALQVIQGDQATERDAERIRRAGAPAVQLNTGAGCHLDAKMIAGCLREMTFARGSLLAIENVGNLVCPALFDLGEAAKVVITSVTEGEDKPIKYPHMFRASRLMVINKVDLLPHVDFDMEACVGFARQVNPDIEVLCVSAKRGDGLQDWYRWIQRYIDGIVGRMPKADA